MILVLTYAKVCTTSTSRLLSELFPGDTFNTHGLGPWLHDPLSQCFAADNHLQSNMRVFHAEAPRIAQRLQEAMAIGEPVTIISGIRDPIARSISVTMQNFETDFADCRRATAEATAEAVASAVADLWLRDTTDGDPARIFLERMIRAPLTWLHEEIEKPFGFDLQAHPFDRERGYVILSRENVRLLLFRHENAPAAIEQGLADLFPGMNFTLPHENDGGAKPSAEIYRALQKSFRLPRAALEKIYANPYVQPYYSSDEIAAAIDRWADDRPARPPAAPRPTFAATVFIPVRNHAEWIGRQLDSLFAQWRSDTELVLIDDGSHDGSFATALDRLSGRPEVAATIMRNGQALGHGMLPSLVSLARSPLFIQADSDDITLPGRLDTIVDHFSAHPDCKLLTSNAVRLSEGEIPIGLYDTQMSDTVIDDPVVLADQQNNPYWLGATSAFHRSVIDAFPPLDPELCPYGLDLLNGLRATLLGHQHYLARPLVGWRQHSDNSHRVSGWLSGDPVGQEHSTALNVMIRAQRLRDIAWLRTQGKLDPSRAADIEARWTADFMTRIDDWIRLRNRLTGTHAAPAPQAGRGAAGGTGEARPHVPPIPPIITLPRGYQRPVSDIGAALDRWSGFYKREEAWIWTGRQALAVLRIPDPDARTLVVTLGGAPHLDQQSIFLSLDFAPPVEARLTGRHPMQVSVPITRPRDKQDALVTLLIDAPDAATPARIDPEIKDNRHLGAVLFALEVT